ncbi:MAG: hypothetical protein ACI9TH_002750 [Kiritimatiellia bacterium]|jgi:hypothetical protein
MQTPRRSFLRSAAAVSLAATASPLFAAKPPESVVKTLFDSMTDLQRKEVCFTWDYQDPNKGLLRTRLENNWRITKPFINSPFYTDDQRDMIRAIFNGITHPDWHARFDQQLKDDIGGFGQKQSIAIFGEPGTDTFEFVITSRHLTLRCDGNRADSIAFAGPILYGHEGEKLYEKPDHPNNVFWHQAKEANKLIEMFDGRQREKAIVLKGMPSEEFVSTQGKTGTFHGIGVRDFSADQKNHLQGVVKLLLEPFREADQNEAMHCLKQQGGLDDCHLAFYKEGDLGEDGLYDNWRLEGPSFVWYFRGTPHVHVWVNVAGHGQGTQVNSYQDSVGV